MSLAGWVIVAIFVVWCLGFVHRHFTERAEESRQQPRPQPQPQPQPPKRRHLVVRHQTRSA